MSSRRLRHALPFYIGTTIGPLIGIIIGVMLIVLVVMIIIMEGSRHPPSFMMSPPTD